MWNIRRQFLRNKKGEISTVTKCRGFGLIELIIVLAIFSILVSSFYSILDLSTKTLIFADNEDEILLQGRYIIDYIKNEINGADKIIASYKILNLDTQFPSNIGFVLFEDNDGTSESKNDRYRFYTYYLKNDKIIRISINKGNSVYPIASDLRGYNEMCGDVLSIEDTNMDYEDKLLELKISFGRDGKEVHCFECALYINNIVDY